MTRDGHDGDCTIYMSLNNHGVPEAGICTCGYGWSLIKSDCDWSQIYSKELKLKLKKRSRQHHSSAEIQRDINSLILHIPEIT